MDGDAAIRYMWAMSRITHPTPGRAPNKRRLSP